MATQPPSAPAEPLTLDQVRANLRQPPVQENDRLTDLIVAAREYVEEKSGLVLTRRTVTETASSLGRWIELASWPVASIDVIRIPSGAGLVVLDSSAWATSLKRRPVRIVPALTGWGVGAAYGIIGRPSVPIEIDVTAGFETPDTVPMRAKQAMHLLVAHWFANREGVETGQRAAAIEVPLGVADLIRGLKLARI
jgi:uncharacterized phiE125 gp8 family phage protein